MPWRIWHRARARDRAWRLRPCQRQVTWRYSHHGGASDSVIDTEMDSPVVMQRWVPWLFWQSPVEVPQTQFIDSCVATETGTMAFLASGGASDSFHQQCGGLSCLATETDHASHLQRTTREHFDPKCVGVDRGVGSAS